MDNWASCDPVKLTLKRLFKVARKDLSDIVTFKRRPKRKEGAIHRRLGKVLPDRKEHKRNEVWSRDGETECWEERKSWRQRPCFQTLE